MTVAAATPGPLLLDLLALAALGVPALAWLALAALAALGLRSMPRLPGAPATHDADGAPSVSILLAARDEADRIEETVRRALAQRGVRTRVIAVDDRSTDSTGEVLARLAREDERATALRVDALPEGWLGKCHALHVGARHAQSDWLLFIDADTWLSPDAASAGLALAARTGAGHVCLAPAMATSTLPGRATLLAAMLLYAGRAFTVHTPRLGGYMGVGAFNLVRADVYRSFGGHEPLRMEVVDDVKLGLLANRAGARTATRFAPRHVEVEWAGSARSFVGLLRKNAFASQDYSTPRVALIALTMLWMLLAPLASIAVLLSHAPVGVRAAAVVCVLGYLATLLPGALIARRFGWDALAVALSPLGHWVVLGAGLNSAAHTLRAGGVRWRETFYPLAALRKGVVR